MTAKCRVERREGRGNEMTSRAAAGNARGAETETKQQGDVEKDVEEGRGNLIILRQSLCTNPITQDFLSFSFFVFFFFFFQ